MSMSRWSICSDRSLLSVASTGSVLSIGSVGSVLSIGSIGSACSAWSVGSFGSFGSMLSTRSRWPVLSDRSYGAVLASREAHTRAGGLSAAARARRCAAHRPDCTPCGVPATVAAKPERQLGCAGSQPSSRRAFAFEEPRDCVIIATPTSPVASRPIQAGT